MPVHLVDGEYQTLLGLSPEEGGYANDPVLGLVKNLGVSGTFLSFLEIYVGILAATILFIATNAGVIGASRITYAMAGYRQLPEVFRRLHPRFKTPWLSLIVFAGIVSIVTLLPGETDFLGTMYSFGAMLSFTIAHISIIALRYRARDADLDRTVALKVIAPELAREDGFRARFVRVARETPTGALGAADRPLRERPRVSLALESLAVPPYYARVRWPTVTYFHVHVKPAQHLLLRHFWLEWLAEADTARFPTLESYALEQARVRWGIADRDAAAAYLVRRLCEGLVPFDAGVCGPYPALLRPHVGHSRYAVEYAGAQIVGRRED